MDDDGELLRRAAKDDQDAWDTLVSRYTNLLWSVARSFRLATADGADAVQTTWLRLLENINRIEDPNRLPGWLVTTVKRECLRILKLGGRDQPRPDDELDRPDPNDGPDADLLAREQYQALWRALEEMPDRCRRLLTLLMASPPLPYESVSEQMGIPIGSIGPTRARCLAKLRHKLDPPGSPDGDRKDMR